MTLEKISTKEERLSLCDIEYTIRPVHRMEDVITMKAIKRRIYEVMPDADTELKNKIDAFRTLINARDFDEIMRLYNSALDDFLTKKPSFAAFNAIFVYILSIAAGCYNA